MPFHIQNSGSKFKVTGPYKGKPGHTYGTHSTREGALAQQRALYANVPEAKEACWAVEYMKKAGLK